MMILEKPYMLSIGILCIIDTEMITCKISDARDFRPARSGTPVRPQTLKLLASTHLGYAGVPYGF
jgi:hypothetical protein